MLRGLGDNNNTRLVPEKTAFVIYNSEMETKIMRIMLKGSRETLQHIDKDIVEENQYKICLKRFSS